MHAISLHLVRPTSKSSQSTHRGGIVIPSVSILDQRNKLYPSTVKQLKLVKVGVSELEGVCQRYIITYRYLVHTDMCFNSELMLIRYNYSSVLLILD